MRCTVASVAALAAAVLVAMAVWPENRAGQGARNALAENAVKAPEKSGVASPTESDLNAETEAKLERFMSVDVADQPLDEYLHALKDSLGINVMFDLGALKDAALEPSTIPVGVVLKNVRLRTILNKILSQHNLGYFISDGILIVSTTDKINSILVIRIYDCRDILAADRPENRTSDAVKLPSKSDDHATKNENTANLNYKPITPNGSVRKHYFSGTSAERLINVIKTVVASPTWDDVGGQGSAEEYGGLLVVNQTVEVHSQVSDLLQQITGKLAAAKK